MEPRINIYHKEAAADAAAGTVMDASPDLRQEVFHTVEKYCKLARNSLKINLLLSQKMAIL